MDNNLIKSILHLKDVSAYRLDEGDEDKKDAKAAGHEEGSKERKDLKDGSNVKTETKAKKNAKTKAKKNAPKMKHSESEKKDEEVPEKKETPKTEGSDKDNTDNKDKETPKTEGSDKGDTDNKDNDTPVEVGGEDIPKDEDEGNGGEPTDGEGNGNTTPAEAQAAADKVQVMNIEKTITAMMSVVGNGKEVDPETFINNYDSIMNILAGLFKYETKGEAVKSDGTGSTPTTADEDKAKEKVKPANDDNKGGDANKDNSNGGE